MPDAGAGSGQLTGRVAIVTGAGSGIGAATARLFHAEGARVLLGDVQDDAGQALAEKLGERATYLHVDVTREVDVAGAVETAVDRFGRLDVMVNNAGILGAVGPIADTPLEAIDTTLAVNLRGVILGVKHAARPMLRQGSGSIISLSSPGGIVGGVGPHVYSAAKAGVIGFVQSAAAELRTAGVRANVLVPGSVVSPMTAGVVAGGAEDLDGAEQVMDQTKLMTRTLRPDDVAQGALYLASDASTMVTGIVLPVDAGYTGARGPAPFATGEYATPSVLREAGRTGDEEVDDAR